jgi:hypothetical protein
MAHCVLSAGSICSPVFGNRCFSWLCESLDINGYHYNLVCLAGQCASLFESSRWLGSVLRCLNHRVQWNKGRGATPWTINFREGKNGL